ncbi:hypothetical protein [Actinoplanes sp. G11-F43]|uniref:hypothetical protein n=1 Tax=Actinoplanes sp. G11-F43 TaxID=3424130 RepID=UPI003D34A37C
MKLMDARTRLIDSHRTLRIGDLTLTSARLTDGTMTILADRRQEDGSWQWAVDEPTFLGGAVR